MKNQKRQKIILTLAVWLLIVTIIALERSDYFYSNIASKYTYEHVIEEYLANIGPLQLNPPNKDALMRSIEVSTGEIDQYRYRYGSKEEQIADITFQYKEAIDEANQNGNEARKTKLTEERDKKIQDIKQNFEDDEHVKKKIIKEKKKVVESYFEKLEALRTELGKNFFYVSYELTDQETKEVKRQGDVGAKALKTYPYNKDTQLLTTETYDSNVQWVFHDGEYTHWPMLTNTKDGEVNNRPHYYSGTIIIDENKFKTSSDYNAYREVLIKHYLFLAFVASGIVSLFILIMMKARLKDLYMPITLFHNMKLDAHLAIVVIAVFSFMISISRVSNLLLFEQNSALIPSLIWVIITTWLVVTSINSLIYRAQLKGDIVTLLRESYLRQMLVASYDILLNRSLFLQTTLLLSCSFIGGMAAIMILNGAGGMFIFTFILCFILGFLGFFLFLARMGYLSRIIKDTEDLAAGKLNRPIAIKGRSVFAKHAQSLNELREGVRNSMNEQAKSERLKTELITNVSHDLRTPLTSIITYTELLKNENLTPEERRQYVDVLDKKAERLKILIDDLFEVSKMASGNMELHKQRLDLAELVTQVVGEHEEELTKKNLELRMVVPTEPCYAYVDGQKMWRLIDNLMINVQKYALEHTRVYVTLQENKAGQAELSVKNIAKYEIGDNVDELFERFKRADKSRNTEGSGLGLAIAQSIVDMHDAKMSIAVDGDLFKVTVNIEKVH